MSIRNSRNTRWGIGVLAALMASIAPQHALAAPPAAAVLEPDAVVADGGNGVHSRFALLAQQAASAVVHVETSRTITQTLPQNPFGELFPDLFGNPGRPGQPSPRRRGEQPEIPPQREFRVPSMGTGFVISADGYILTNNHVIDGVDEIEVRFLDGERLDAEVVGTDPQTDVALIRVKGKKDLPTLALGDSAEILPGDWVLAIGNPFGLDHTVTVGIVSAKGRQLGQGQYDDFIQTDAAINPGNSGGPLLNMRGEVIGINSAINPQANTIGFAIPSNLVKTLITQLREKGHVTRGWLGVGLQTVTPELQKAFGLAERKGAIIAEVQPDSPAAKAGLRSGDVILRFKGEDVKEMDDLPQRVAETPVGSKAELEILRGKDRRTLQVEIGELAREPRQTARASKSESGLDSFGFSVSDLSPDLRERLGTERRSGAVVTHVDPNGAAAAAGIQQGDVVLEVNRKPVKSAAELAKALDGQESALLFISRGDSTLYVPIERLEE
jgi:serine protease Do